MCESPISHVIEGVKTMNLKRVEQTLNEINQFGRIDNGVTRLAFTNQEKQATEYFINHCEREGLQVRVDECGNVIARREGLNPGSPVVAVGSHLDTVGGGGRFDGTLGVVAGLEVVRSLNDQGIVTKHPIEIISFACEESARFGVSTIGSKAMTGLLSKDEISNLIDKEGMPIREAFSNRGLDFTIVDQAARRRGELKAFFELHVEQGPLLEKENKQIGIATAISSPTRLEVKVKGKSSHSGTTSMNLRKDALLGASEICLALEQSAKKEAHNGTVATTGVFEVKTGAMNVVPGDVEMKIDIRSTSMKSKQKVVKKLLETFDAVIGKRGLSVTWNLLSDEEPVPLDKEISTGLSKMCDRLGVSSILMPSGAGHDAMNMAKICPTGLIFVPSVDGLSHHADEYTAIEDIGVGVKLLEEAVLKWAIVQTTSASGIHSPTPLEDYN
jgi:hydantoinase/carbamoylase family amidase